MLGLAAVIAAGAIGAWSQPAKARIECSGPFQVVRGHGKIATPYCEDEYLGQVARSYGIQVSGHTIRQNPNRKQEVCKTIGHDSRVYDICLKYLDYGQDRLFD
jgi:hypothetical protein